MPHKLTLKMELVPRVSRRGPRLGGHARLAQYFSDAAQAALVQFEGGAGYLFSMLFLDFSKELPVPMLTGDVQLEEVAV